MIVDDNYLYYHKDRPTPAQIIERKLKMKEKNNNVLQIIAASDYFGSDSLNIDDSNNSNHLFASMTAST
jgi:hypothetical protein